MNCEHCKRSLLAEQRDATAHRGSREKRRRLCGAAHQKRRGRERKGCGETCACHNRPSGWPFGNLLADGGILRRVKRPLETAARYGPRDPSQMPPGFCAPWKDGGARYECHLHCMKAFKFKNGVLCAAW